MHLCRHWLPSYEAFICTVVNISGMFIGVSAGTQKRKSVLSAFSCGGAGYSLGNKHLALTRMHLYTLNKHKIDCCRGQ